MYLHELTLQIPKSIYINLEQTPKYFKKSELLQTNIDRAFFGKQRTTNNIARFEDYKIYLLSGKHTNNLGVTEIETAQGKKLKVASIERTVIDINVRPVYAGGAFQFIEAFKLAKDKVSINKLSAILQKIDYIYPYHQAIGFYLERAGVYKESQINLMKKFDMKHNFYLVHNMKETDYSEKWRIFYPKGF
jgi:predicted transcriptional regulator of viral defense system